MNQTKKNGNWKRKMEPYAFLVPLVLIFPISGYSVSKSSDHEF